MAQYLKPDSALGYIEDSAEIEYLKMNNLRHTVLGCMLGDFDEVGNYVVSPDVVRELISMEKYIVESYDNIELCKSELKLDKQISFMVTFEGNRATLALIEKMNYEANFAINSGSYSDINEYVLDTVETSGEINRNALYLKWNIKSTQGNIVDIFNCDDSVLEKFFGIVNRFKYLLKANTVLLEKEEALEEVEAEYANEIFAILNHYPKLQKEVLKTIKTNLEEKKNAVSVKKPYFAKTLNEVVENAIQKNIGVLEEKEQKEFVQEKRNAVVTLNIKREDILEVEKTTPETEVENETTQNIIVVKTPRQDKTVVEVAKEFVRETTNVQKRIEGKDNNKESTDLMQRVRERVQNSKKEMAEESHAEESHAEENHVEEKQPENDNKRKNNQSGEKQKLIENLTRAELGKYFGLPEEKKKEQENINASTQEDKKPVKKDDETKKPVNNNNASSGGSNNNSNVKTGGKTGGKTDVKKDVKKDDKKDDKKDVKKDDKIKEEIRAVYLGGGTGSKVVSTENGQDENVVPTENGQGENGESSTLRIKKDHDIRVKKYDIAVQDSNNVTVNQQEARVQAGTTKAVNTQEASMAGSDMTGSDEEVLATLLLRMNINAGVNEQAKTTPEGENSTNIPKRESGDAVLSVDEKENVDEVGGSLNTN